MEAIEDGFTLSDQERAIVEVLRDRNNLMVANFADEVQLVAGLPPAEAATVAIHFALEMSIMMAMWSARLRGVEPDRDRWMKACGGAWDQFAPAFAAAVEAVDA